ncbi:MAG: hypothetical protein HUJ74_03430 [Lachnospiraceae bacterium]|nr:hypothetical protein [Lachnospiraceae bacterium]
MDKIKISTEDKCEEERLYSVVEYVSNKYSVMRENMQRANAITIKIDHGDEGKHGKQSLEEKDDQSLYFLGLTVKMDELFGNKSDGSLIGILIAVGKS